MQKEEFINRIKFITDDFSFTPSLYALLSKDGSYTLKRIRISKTLEQCIKDIASDWLNAEIFGENFDLNDISLIDENKKIFYGLGSYSSSITFPQINTSETIYFSKEDQINLVGLLVYINKDNEYFWLYQHRYPITRITQKNFILALLDGEETYNPIESDIFRIDYKFDFIITDDFLAAKNWKLLQQHFGFENYVRKIANQYIETIENIDFISDTSKIKECSNNFKFAKKLMKLKNSKVLMR